MDFQLENNDKSGSIVVLDGDKKIGLLTYFFTDSSTIAIDHTEVNHSYQGQGIAKQLVYKAVDFARENNLSIRPMCSYARIIFEKDKSLNDLLI